MELNFVRKKNTFNLDHLNSLKKAIELGHGTWGSIEALKHCNVITISVESGEDIDEIKNVFYNSFYTEINEIAF